MLVKINDQAKEYVSNKETQELAKKRGVRVYAMGGTGFSFISGDFPENFMYKMTLTQLYRLLELMPELEKSREVVGHVFDKTFPDSGTWEEMDDRTKKYEV